MFGLSCTEEQIAPEEEVIFSQLLENQKLASKIFKVDIPYAVLLPEDYNESTSEYPVVYLLHGFGDDEKAWYTTGKIKYYSNLYKNDIEPMIYVMPIGYNTYYVNQYTGNYPYMDMLTDELVPAIDSLFRTKANSASRAVMGYSMGGYGALVLPALNPEVFSISVPLSMSFRTNKQYLAEPQGVFDYQWGRIFGGRGVIGEGRLTDHFKAHSPFYFFVNNNSSNFDNFKLLIDCGDDEASLSITNDSLHTVLRNMNIAHEYRVRDGGHSFDYWWKSYPEALRFISNGFQGIQHTMDGPVLSYDQSVTDEQIESYEMSGITLNVMKPDNYSPSTEKYPLIYIFHQRDNDFDPTLNKALLSLAKSSINSNKVGESIVIEMPMAQGVETNQINDAISELELELGINSDEVNRIILGNQDAGMIAAKLALDYPALIHSCFLFGSKLDDSTAEPNSSVFYYLDNTDDSESYMGYHILYSRIRETGTEYEYRVRNGTYTYESFLLGLDESLSTLNKQLKANNN